MRNPIRVKHLISAIAQFAFGERTAANGPWQSAGMVDARTCGLLERWEVWDIRAAFPRKKGGPLRLKRCLVGHATSHRTRRKRRAEERFAQ